ncbi:MAG: hypothetical protein V3V47_03920, partial [Desulfobacteria bacterium]
MWIQTKRGRDREWAAEHLAGVDREKCCDVACGDTSKFGVSGGAGAATQLIDGADTEAPDGRRMA